ncbi:hypothetical protein [Pseudomonas sp. zfem002]|uniref:right-handed parallel beta-helix repeat-containing protein n=1 Tax=Pseudomonas sp. zfem002 TaxID=3078197 RepID=UPI0029280D46|nr:hypothetical protein [Pseudomonas sp. zfem002]MDU9391995.1 hypothetical protein [Pseudomonas sp. zfem002]
MSDYLHDVRSFGAVGDGLANDTQAFRRTIEHATLNGGKVVACGRFRISGYVTITCDCDFSQATLVIDDACLTIAHTRDWLDQNQRRITLFDKSALVELQSSLRGVLDDELIEDFENAYVRIDSEGENAIYVYRSLGSSTQRKGTVSLMKKHGRLAYALNHDYRNVETVTLTLRRLPHRRLTFVCPQFEILRHPTANYLLQVRRDLVSVINFSMTHSAPDTDTPTYYAMIGCHECYDVTFEHTHTPGYGNPNNEPGVAEKVRYDIMLGHALKVHFDNVSSNTGWRSIDGNHSRDIRITNSNLYGVHGHFNLADITIENCRIFSGGISIGTGAPDACLTVRNCVFTSKGGGAVSMRPDYGELRGRVVIENCQLLMSSLTDEGRVATILSLADSAIKATDQPNVYALPTSIVIRDILVYCKGACSILAIGGDEYNERRRLKAPRDITIENVKTISRDRANLLFDYRFVPYDAETVDPTSITLRNIDNLSGKVVVQMLGAASGQTTHLQYRLHLETISNLALTVVGGRRSTLGVRECSLLRLDCYHGGPAWLKALSVSDCRFHFANDFDPDATLITSKYIQSMRFSGCLFDASQYRAQTGRLLPLTSLTHLVSGCMSIDCHGVKSLDEGRGLKELVPLPGTENCFTSEADGTLRPLSAP